MTQASAHEYWLEPIATDFVVGDKLKADIRNGQDLVGNALPFQPDVLSRAGLISDNTRQSLSGRLGDYPAFQMSVEEPGLHLLLLETRQHELRYPDYTDFNTFLDYHGLQTIAERHLARELPQKDIIEHYYRYCKALIFVEETAGSPDKPVQQTPAALQAQGQRLELIADSNPLLSESLRLQLQFEGNALAGRQVELFHRDSNDTVTRTVADTDDEGFVTFSIPDKGDYLANSVKLAEPSNTSAHWETLWASLYFQKS